MAIFKRHIFVTIFLGIYMCWWLFSTYQLYIFYTTENRSCGYGYTGVFLYLMNLILGGVYVLSMLINVILKNGQNRNDFIKFLVGVAIPPVLLFLFIFALH